MKHALDVWYFTDTNAADDPVTVESNSDLERVLAEVLAHKQFHPTVVCVKDRPTLDGPLNLPDHQLKFDVDVSHRIAAIHTMGPSSFLPANFDVHGAVGELPEGVMRAWVTKGSYSDSTTVGPTCSAELFVDFDTRTRFPADAGISLEKLREALEEFGETGLRPTCVDWQDSDVF